MKVVPYLFFEGNCEEAFTFYHSVLGGKIMISRVEGSPAEDQFDQNMLEKVLHASLEFDESEIMASDNLGPTPMEGNSSAVCLTVESQDKVDEYFEKLSEGGDVIMKPEQQFWGSYHAMFNDKFGRMWMLDFSQAPA